MSTFQDKYANRYAEESKVDVYFVSFSNADDQSYYFYVMASALLRKEFIKAKEAKVIPDFAVVLRHGPGEPSEDTKQKMKDYYGFDHAVYEAQVASSGGAAND